MSVHPDTLPDSPAHLVKRGVSVLTIGDCTRLNCKGGWRRPQGTERIKEEIEVQSYTALNQ